MKCSKCGSKLSEDTKFCSYCGQQVEQITDAFDEIPTATNRNFDDDSNEEEMKTPNVKSTFSEKIKNRSIDFWNGLDAYGKITVMVYQYSRCCAL